MTKKRKIILIVAISLCAVLLALGTFFIVKAIVDKRKNGPKELNYVSAQLFKDETLQLKVSNYKEQIEWSSSVDSVATVDENGKVTAVSYGNTTISAQLDNKKLLCKISVVAEKTDVEVQAKAVFSAQNKQIALLNPTDLKGENVSQKTSASIELYTDGMETVDNANVIFSVDNAEVATVDDSGTIQAKSSGNANVLCTWLNGETATIPISVYYPVYDAQDLDTLALVSYTQDKETAKKYLSANYLLMNDIDYSTHERNYILPIASVTHEFGRVKKTGAEWLETEDYDNVVRSDLGEFTLGGVSRGTYYSIGWKNVLGLTEDSKDVNGTLAWYMKNSNKAGYAENVVGEEFRGVNPNALAFSGIINGNGYAIKNAYYMTDNMQGHSRNTGVVSLRSNGYNGVGGFFIGYNVGTIENLELHVSVANPRDYYYNGGKYGKTQVDGSLTINELYKDVATGKQRVLLTSQGKIISPLDNYSPNKGGEGTGATGIVALNNGILRNLYHNVSVYSSFAESYMASQGVMASINGYKIENCVVNKLESCYQAGETTIATKTLNKNAGYDATAEMNVRYRHVGDIKGSEIIGCYSLFKRDCTHQRTDIYWAEPKALSFGSETAFFGGMIDEISNTVFTDAPKGQTAQEWNSDPVGMYAATIRENNLDDALWAIGLNGGTLSVELKNGNIL